MKKRRCGFTLGVVLILALSFTACTATGASSVAPATSQSTVNVAQNTSSPGPAKEYVMPQEMVNFLGRTPDEILQDIAESDVPNLYTDAWINEEGTPTLLVTEEQRKNWLEDVERLLEKHIRTAFEDGITIQVSTDKKMVTMYASKDVYPVSILVRFAGVMTEVFKYHFYNDVLWNDYDIIVTIVNQDTGYILAQATFPSEAFEYTPEDWETSKTRDAVENPLPYEVEGYPVPGPSSSLAEQSNPLASSSVAVVGAASTSAGASASTSEAHQAQASSFSAESSGKAVQPAPSITIVVQDEAPTSVVVENAKPIELTFRQKAWIWIYDNPILAILILLGIIAAIVFVCRFVKQKRQQNR